MNMNDTQTIFGPDRVMDVREIPCSRKHGLILQTCLDLPVGGHFILLNGHDPVRLQQQVAATWPGAFAWEHLARAEGEIRVKITKLKAVRSDSDLPPGFTCAH